ncbi:MAG: TIGR04013 family B12-binding domain/radical SAM domain-containing protein, partial [Aliifodinibius sp.]|nr:TIGR04013 family B12-binding domain/radical SAM domain-containing protein [Fodinibius sp.]
DAVLLKNAIDYPEAKFCLAGPHATVKPMDGISHGFDSVIVGEGEEAIFDVLNGREGIISKH